MPSLDQLFPGASDPERVRQEDARFRAHVRQASSESFSLSFSLLVRIFVYIIVAGIALKYVTVVTNTLPGSHGFIEFAWRQAGFPVPEAPSSFMSWVNLARDEVTSKAEGAWIGFVTWVGAMADRNHQREEVRRRCGPDDYDDNDNRQFQVRVETFCDCPDMRIHGLNIQNETQISWQRHLDKVESKGPIDRVTAAEFASGKVDDMHLYDIVQAIVWQFRTPEEYGTDGTEMLCMHHLKHDRPRSVQVCVLRRQDGGQMTAMINPDLKGYSDEEASQVTLERSVYCDRLTAKIRRNVIDVHWTTLVRVPIRALLEDFREAREFQRVWEELRGTYECSPPPQEEKEEDEETRQWRKKMAQIPILKEDDVQIGQKDAIVAIDEEKQKEILS